VQFKPFWRHGNLILFSLSPLLFPIVLASSGMDVAVCAKQKNLIQRILSAIKRRKSYEN
jgi:hypothetical protein